MNKSLDVITENDFDYKKYTFEVIKKMFDNNYLVKKFK